MGYFLEKYTWSCFHMHAPYCFAPSVWLFLIFYIYKEESLCVCSLCIPIPYNRFRWNFPGTILSSRGRSTSTWFEKNTNPTHATSNLWNWPIGLQHLKKWKGQVAKAAEGRLSAHRQDLTCFTYLWKPCGCWRLPTLLTNQILAFFIITGLLTSKS